MSNKACGPVCGRMPHHCFRISSEEQLAVVFMSQVPGRSLPNIPGTASDGFAAVRASAFRVPLARPR